MTMIGLTACSQLEGISQPPTDRSVLSCAKVDSSVAAWS